VNFSKSRLIGVNVPTNFLERAASFLHCKIGSLPFVYLGLPVGANPRRVATWEPVVKTIEKRLFSWRNQYISLAWESDTHKLGIGFNPGLLSLFS
jgi:hypothetical protein